MVGKIVSFANKNNKALAELKLQDFQSFDKNISKKVFLILSSTNSMKSKKSFGGTSPQNVKKSIQYAIKKYL